MTLPSHNLSGAELLAYLETEKYFNLRILEDGTVVGCFRMLFTWATVIGIDAYCYDGRVCWNTKEEAIAYCNMMVTIDTPPPPGYTAIK